MNIFILEGENNKIDWKKSAESLDNLRIVKMILESTQMISTIYQQYDKKEGLYKPTHLNHPCTQWVGQSFENFSLAIQHTHYMNEEFNRRFGKTHKSIEIIKSIQEQEFKHFFHSFSFTLPPLAMNEEFKSEDIIESYRDYFVSKDLMKYNLYDIPSWFYEKRNKPFFVRRNNDSKYILMEV